MQMYSARAMHVHHAPCHEMTHTIELRSLKNFTKFGVNRFGVQIWCRLPNLVSIAQNFLGPEDPSRINFSGLVARSLHPTRTATTKTYRLT